MPHRLTRLLVVTLALAFPMKLEGQLNDSRVLTPDSFQGMSPAEVLRVQTDKTRFEGRFIGVDAGALRLNLQDRAERVELAAIDTMWVHHSNIGKSMLIGTGIGAVAGLGYVALLCGLDCSAGSFSAVSLIFGGIGFVTGAVVGAATSHWELRWFR